MQEIGVGYVCVRDEDTLHLNLTWEKHIFLNEQLINEALINGQ